MGRSFEEEVGCALKEEGRAGVQAASDNLRRLYPQHLLPFRVWGSGLAAVKWGGIVCGGPERGLIKWSMWKTWEYVCVCMWKTWEESI